MAHLMMIRGRRQQGEAVTGHHLLLVGVIVIFVSCMPVLIEAPTREFMVGNPDIDRTKICSTPTSCAVYRIQATNKFAVPFQFPPLPTGAGKAWLLLAAGVYTSDGPFPPSTPVAANYYFILRDNDGSNTIPGRTRYLSTQNVATNPNQLVQRTCADATFKGEDLVATPSATLQRLDFPTSTTAFLPGITFWLEFNAVSQVDIWGTAVAGGTFPRCRLLNTIADTSDIWATVQSNNCSAGTAWEFPIVIWARPNGTVSTATTNEYQARPPGLPYALSNLQVNRTIAFSGMWFFSQVEIKRADLTDATNFVVSGFGIVLHEETVVTKTVPVVFRLFRSTQPSGYSSTAGTYPYGEPLATMEFAAWPTAVPAPGGSPGDNLYRFMGDAASQVNLLSPDIDLSSATAKTGLWVGMYVTTQTGNLLQLPVAVSTGAPGLSYFLGTSCNHPNFAMEPCDARSPLGTNAFMSPNTYNMWLEAYINVNSAISTTTSSTVLVTSSTSSTSLSSTTASTFLGTSSTSSGTSSTSSTTTSGTSVSTSSTSETTSATSESTSGTFSTIQGTTSSTIGATLASTTSTFMSTRLTALSSLTRAGVTVQITTASTSSTSTTGANSDTTVVRLTSTGGTVASTTGTGTGGRTTDGRPAGAVPVGLSSPQTTAYSVNGSHSVAIRVQIPEASSPSRYRVVGFGAIGPLLTWAQIPELLYLQTDPAYPDMIQHEVRTAEALEVNYGFFWVAFTTNLPVSISGYPNDEGLYDANPTDLIPNTGEVFGATTPSYNLALYALVITTPTGQQASGGTTPPPTGSKAPKKKAPIAIILIVLLIVIIVIAVIVGIVWFLCKKMSSGEDNYEFEVNELHNTPSLTPQSQSSYRLMADTDDGYKAPHKPSNGTSNPRRESIIDCT